MTRIIFYLGLSLLYTPFTFSQPAIIKVHHTSYSNQYESFDEIQFEFNGESFSGADTGWVEVDVRDTFDQGIAIIGTDTLHFLLKFKHGQSYTIKPGCCCAAFTLTADSNAHRGTVRVTNSAERDLLVMVTESNSDTVEAKSTSQPLFAHESAMCLFKPAYILLAEMAYGNKKYQYSPDKSMDFQTLQAEREAFIIHMSWFHFLHGEKIELRYEEHTDEVTYSFDGYLTPQERKQVRTFD